MKEQGEGEVLEIEHKYLLTSPPSELFVPYERFMIIQTYLQNDVGCSERVRDNRCLQTGKVVYTHTSKRPGPNGG